MKFVGPLSYNCGQVFASCHANRFQLGQVQASPFLSKASGIPCLLGCLHRILRENHMEPLLERFGGVEEGTPEARLVAISPTIKEQEPQSNKTKPSLSTTKYYIAVTLLDNDRVQKVIATRGAHHCHPYSATLKDSLSSQPLHQVQHGCSKRHG